MIHWVKGTAVSRPLVMWWLHVGEGKMFYSRVIRSVFFFNFKKCLFIFEREAKCEQGRGRKRGRQNLKQAPSSELLAQSLMWGLNSGTVRS